MVQEGEGAGNIFVNARLAPTFEVCVLHFFSALLFNGFRSYTAIHPLHALVEGYHD